MNKIEKKALFDKGGWICIMRDTFFDSKWEEVAFISANIRDSIEVELIHIKHKEVLDHVLSGGKCEWLNPHIGFNQRWENGDEFIERYNHKLEYKIIPTEPKQDLNCCICLATKEHFSRLVKDLGLDELKVVSPDYTKCEYFQVELLEDGYTIWFYEDKPHGKPMHLHNNEWKSGFLTHEEFDKVYDEAMERGNDFQMANEPKPVEPTCVKNKETYPRSDDMGKEDLIGMIRDLEEKLYKKENDEDILLKTIEDGDKKIWELETKLSAFENIKYKEKR